MRFALQRYGTWEWLDYEAFLLTDDGPEWGLNMYGIMTATVPAPAARTSLAVDGRPLFEEWGTIVHVEDSTPGVRRRKWTGFVSSATLGAAGWKITVLEHPGYLKGVPWQGLIRGVKDSPADMVRQLVAETQAWPGAWYGCTVTGEARAKLGTDLDDRIAVARATMDARRSDLDSISEDKNLSAKILQTVNSEFADAVATARAQVTAAQKALAELIQAGASTPQIESARIIVEERQEVYQETLTAHKAETDASKESLLTKKSTKKTLQAAYDKAKAAYEKLRDTRKDNDGAYIVDGEDLHDSYKVLQMLCEDGGLEWTTTTTYTEGEPQVGIVLHDPVAGGRRDDLIFDTDTNILDELELERTPFANAAIGVGAGEGKKAIRRITDVPSLRMRRPTVVEDRSATTNARMDAAMRTALRGMRGEAYPTRITVRDHINARIGSWRPGDVITVSGVTSVGSRWSGLVRIESWSWPSDNRAILHLVPV